MVTKRRTYLTQILREMDGGSNVVSTQAQFQALLNNGGPFKNKKYVGVDGEIDLPDAEDFSGSSFENIQFSRAHPRRHVDFSNCRFSDSVLSAIVWTESEFANSVFHNSHIGSEFARCDFDGAVFDNLIQDGTILFNRCHLDNTQFKGKISNITFHENTIDTMSFACKSIRDVLIDADCVVKNMSIRAETLFQLIFQRASVANLDIHAGASWRCRFVETPVTNIKFHVEDRIKGFSMTNSTFENFEIQSNSFSEGYIYRNSFTAGVFSVNNVLESNIHSNVMDQIDFSGTQFEGCSMLYNIYHNCKFDNCVFQWCTFNNEDDVEKDYIFDTCKVDGAKFVGCALNKYNKERLLENGATIEEGMW